MDFEQKDNHFGQKGNISKPRIEKISKEEVKSLITKPIGQKSYTRTWVESMEVGEFIKIYRKDWPVKSKIPSYICRIVEKGSRKRFRVLDILDKSGWIIERVK